MEQEAQYYGDYVYTDYEEVYGTTSHTQPNPYGSPDGFMWYFHETCNGDSGCNYYTPWTGWKTSNAPGGTVVKILIHDSVPEIAQVNSNGQNKGCQPR